MEKTSLFSLMHQPHQSEFLFLLGLGLRFGQVGQPLRFLGARLKQRPPCDQSDCDLFHSLPLILGTP
ncbi:MAG: hypothetical protein DME25_17975 [Verrucomicrobia bacterium]|nr:MAG: hypothetical protein DME25_17975 [Verrucomicrobiota bacterium]